MDACYAKINDTSDNVKFADGKIYYNIPTSINNTGIGCLEHRPKGYVDNNGNVYDSDRLVVGSDGNCATRYKSHMNSSPTLVAYDTFDKESDYIRTVNNNVGQCLILDTHDDDYPFVYSNGVFLNSDKHMALWSFTDESKIHSGDYYLSTDDKRTVSVNKKSTDDNIYQHWVYDNKQLMNVATNKCMSTNTGQPELVDCGQTNVPNEWEYKDNMFRNKKTGKCLDGNGTNVYMSECMSGNPYQQWTVMNSGEKIKHIGSSTAGSDKCLKRYTSGNDILFGFKACGCDGVSDSEYSNYIKSKATECSNLTHWGYDGSGPNCYNYIFDSDALMDGFISWCDKNSSNESISKLCMSKMKSGTLLSYYPRACKTGKDMLTKPTCISIFGMSDSVADEKTREYMRIRYDESLEKYCSESLTVNEGVEVPSERKKYSTNWEDPECIGNWMFKHKDGTTEMVQLLTDIKVVPDTSLDSSIAQKDDFWCYRSTGKDDPLTKCSLPNKNANSVLTSTGYADYNKIWKEEGSSRDLPTRLYKKFVLKFGARDDRYNALRDYIKSTYKSTTAFIHPADCLLFYTGYPIYSVTAKDVAPTKAYSENGEYRLYYDSCILVRVNIKEGTYIYQDDLTHTYNSTFSLVNNNGVVQVLTKSGDIRTVALVSNVVGSTSYNRCKAKWSSLTTKAFTLDIYKRIAKDCFGKSAVETDNFITSNLSAYSSFENRETLGEDTVVDHSGDSSVADHLASGAWFILLFVLIVLYSIGIVRLLRWRRSKSTPSSQQVSSL